MALIRFLRSKGPFHIEFKSIKSGRKYAFHFNKEKQKWWCTCASYTYSKGTNRDCKHLRDFVAGAFDNPPEPKKQDEFYWELERQQTTH